MKTLIVISCIVFGAVLFGWHDLFHFVVGLPLLLACELIAWWVRKWRAEEEEEEKEDITVTNEDPLVRKFFIGALKGIASLVLLAAAFSLASRTALGEFFYDCQDCLAQIRTLESAEAYSHIVQTVEERLRRKTSAGCRRQLAEKKLQALMSWAEQFPNPEERMGKLRQALKEAQQHRLEALVKLAEANIEAGMKQQVIDRQKDEIERNKQLLDEFKQKFQPKDGGSVTTLSDLLFQPGQAELKPEASEEISRIARLLNQLAPGKIIRVEGHTDSTGLAVVNLKLSEERAARAADALAAAGVSREWMLARGFGASRPIASNGTLEGRERNRRVEIIIPN